MEQQPESVLAMREWIRDELLRNSDDLPSLPNAVQEILRLANDPEAEAVDFERVLRTDPVMVARLLAIANSSVRGISRHITAVHDAVMVVGFQRLATMALTAGVTNYFNGEYRCYGYTEKGLWQHSVCVATCAQVLGNTMEFEFGVREELFVAGLLHDIGKILLGPYLSRVSAEAVGRPADAARVERDLLGIDHAEAAEFLAKKWKLSPLVTAVACNRDIGQVPEDIGEAVAVVRLADDFVHEHEIGHLPGSRPYCPVPETDMGFSGCGHEEWREVRVELKGAINAALEQIRVIDSPAS